MSDGATLIPRTARDWNDLWRVKQRVRTMNHDASYWNERAKTFTNKDTPGSYTDRFLALADIHPQESVMDMGCGTGNLSVPLGEAGHEVLAADFSSAMLARLDEALRQRDIHDVQTKLLSWEDDWETHGVMPGSFDVCIASRSIATEDLQGALDKLTATARRRCCITLATGASPRLDMSMLRSIGTPLAPSYDDIYALAILQGEGYAPTLTYIDTVRTDRFASFEEALVRYRDMADDATKEAVSTLSEDELHFRVRAWLTKNLCEQTDEDGNTFLTQRAPRHVLWAFIAWEV